MNKTEYKESDTKSIKVPCTCECHSSNNTIIHMTNCCDQNGMVTIKE